MSGDGGGLDMLGYSAGLTIRQSRHVPTGQRKKQATQV